ncbi:Glycosyltransferase involved in cell wall bisynthesis [Marisediminitalea aggregata]|uniref:Glycosyltransferase involved in cell wall bisynthesis n=2 Tax=Marisediminitalea aggregata TaxID=634436 RepID=A0A1M5HFU3_9ALTE|nr:Glycosyltransferase involved in cell wall bisynthesis [Marisediminitalea aggregata]
MIFLADLPLPHHGMSAINSALKSEIEGHKIDCLFINTSPSILYKFCRGIFFRPFRPFFHLFCLLRLFFNLIYFKNISVVYRSINGGWGQVYDIAYLVCALCFNKKIYIHHHSFSYFNRKSRLFNLIIKITKGSCVHVVLGVEMQSRLQSMYSVDASEIRIVSNLAFQGPSNGEPVKAKTGLTVGHLANLTVEKGTGFFLDVVKELISRGYSFRASLAGPIISNELITPIENLTEFQSFEYLGSLYGDSKIQYFGKIDIFIFISNYSNEAEPLVLYEAAKSGTLLITSSKGCMSSQTSSLGGFVFDTSSISVVEIADFIQSDIVTQKLKDQQVIDRIQAYDELFLKSRLALNSLISELGK